MISKADDFMISEFYNAILKLETEEECKKFFKDILTTAELYSFAQRLQVAKLLDEDYKYSEIVEKTGASSSTVSRVKKCLLEGAGGYRLVLNNKKEDSERK